ncbi:MAG: hypothetical protein GX220_02530 [Treponema sp.]|jgi:hypothetical protein|nr:hypothetical protein [Treponema sp.]
MSNIKTLSLFQDLCAILPNEHLFSCKTIVQDAQKTSDKAIIIEEKKYIGSGKMHFIPKGVYLFYQFMINEIINHDTKIIENEIWNKIEKKTEELYLEALWQNKTFINNTVYIRKLEEENNTIFQLFQQIKNN